jgi:uncharacterized delta-60 repeat protein
MKRFSIVATVIITFLALGGPASATPGQLDPTFGTGGLVRTDITTKGDVSFGEAIQSDDKIVVVGVTGAGGTNPRFGVARYNADGTLDTSFSGDGKVTTDITPRIDEAISVAVQADGKIVVAGGSNLNATNHNSRFALARYNPDGTLDTSFSADGRVTTDFTSAGDTISQLAIDGAGNIVAVGQAAYTRTDSQAALARYTPAGELDTTFNGTGKVLTNYGSYGDFAAGVAIDGSGNIVTGGAIGIGSSNPRFAVCRYLPTGALDSTFGAGGKVFTGFGPYTDWADMVAIQSTGRIVAAGTAGDGGPNSTFALAGYEAT